MNLSKYPYDDIYEGMEVLSAVGNYGKVVSKYKESGYHPDDTEKWIIKIQWDHGGISVQPWPWLDRVIVVK